MQSKSWISVSHGTKLRPQFIGVEIEKNMAHEIYIIQSALYISTQANFAAELSNSNLWEHFNSHISLVTHFLGTTIHY